MASPVKNLINPTALSGSYLGPVPTQWVTRGPFIQGHVAQSPVEERLLTYQFETVTYKSHMTTRPPLTPVAFRPKEAAFAIVKTFPPIYRERSSDSIRPTDGQVWPRYSNKV